MLGFPLLLSRINILSKAVLYTVRQTMHSKFETSHNFCLCNMTIDGIFLRSSSKFECQKPSLKPTIVTVGIRKWGPSVPSPVGHLTIFLGLRLILVMQFK